MYENRLKELNPEVRNITYEIQDLKNYINSLGDICALVFDSNLGAYLPKDKEWIKQKVSSHLKKLAQK